MRLFIYLTLGFIIATPLGTLSHEAGHYIAARIMGQNPIIHFDRTSYFSSSAKYDKAVELIVRAGGPVVTDLIFIVGFIFLLIRLKKERHSRALVFTDWLLVFACLFSLRNIVVFIETFFKVMYQIDIVSDEALLSIRANAHPLTIPGITALVSLTVMCLVFFVFIPSKERSVFTFSAACGSLLGYLFWFKWLGPILLP